MVKQRTCTDVLLALLTCSCMGSYLHQWPGNATCSLSIISQLLTTLPGYLPECLLAAHPPTLLRLVAFGEQKQLTMIVFWKAGLGVSSLMPSMHDEEHRMRQQRRLQSTILRGGEQHA